MFLKFPLLLEAVEAAFAPVAPPMPAKGAAASEARKVPDPCPMLAEEQEINMAFGMASVTGIIERGNHFALIVAECINIHFDFELFFEKSDFFWLYWIR